MAGLDGRPKLERTSFLTQCADAATGVGGVEFLCLKKQLDELREEMSIESC